MIQTDVRDSGAECSVDVGPSNARPPAGHHPERTEGHECVSPLVVFLIDSPVPPSIHLLKSLRPKEEKCGPIPHLCVLHPILQEG